MHTHTHTRKQKCTFRLTLQYKLYVLGVHHMPTFKAKHFFMFFISKQKKGIHKPVILFIYQGLQEMIIVSG